MAAVYQIKHTDGIRTITIQPGTLSVVTDLQLPGSGTLAWGAGVDQNQLRLLENFACPESIITPGEPMGDVEIGVDGAGINNPTKGQIWFNTTTENLFFYDGDGMIWISVGSIFASNAIEPSNPIVGTLWYDTSVPQLKVCESTGPVVFVSVAENYLLLEGGIMSGAIDMDGSEVLGLPAVPAATGAASKEYVDAGDLVNADAISDNADAISDNADDISDNASDIADLLLAAVPIGTVLMFNAQFTNIPPNWKLCDGNNGTPDMTDRFVYGTTTVGELEDLGGDADAVVVSHTHSFTGDALAGHDHVYDQSIHDPGPPPTEALRQVLSFAIVDFTENIDANTSNVSAGTPSGTNSTEGVSGTDKNLPPFIKLAYIQRMS